MPGVIISIFLQIFFKILASYPEQTIPSNFAFLASDACFFTNSFIDFV